MIYKILDFKQGSQEWLSLRKQMITSTDTACILGLNPFKSAYQLIQEKLSDKPSFVTEKMKEGSFLEEEARDLANIHYKTDYKPIVIQSLEYPFMMSSLDGMNNQGKILEIKCGEKSYIQYVYENIIPDYYMAQLQKNMLISGEKVCIYQVYRNQEKNCFCVVERDDAFIEKIIKAETKFYEDFKNLDFSDYVNDQYEEQNSKEWRILSEIYRQTKSQIKDLEIKEKLIKEELISLCNGVPSKGYGITLSKSIRKGTVDYSCIPELKNVNLDAYRSKSTEIWKITTQNESL